MTADWTAAGAFPVAPGVYRIPLPLPHDALRAVNTYAVEDGDGLVMIDSGWALSEARRRLETVLAEIGHDLGSIRRFLITHVHRDHYTQAIAIRRTLGTRVSIGVDERPSIEAYLDEGRTRLRAQLRTVRMHGGEAVAARFEASAPESVPDGLWEPPDDWIPDRAVISLGSRTLKAIRTPGHTNGHLVYFDSSANVLFAGDHVLPHITPSIGFEPAMAPHPLVSYLDSLQLVRAMPDATLLPAHGPAGGSVHHRVDELLAHHERRLALCHGAVAAGDSTAYEVAQRLTWTRREVALPTLDEFNQVLAVLETAAHLDVLARDGRLVRTRVDGTYEYRESGLVRDQLS